MSCPYSRRIRNRRYTANKKNGGNVPELKDSRLEGVDIGCGICPECRKRRGQEWSRRLRDEIGNSKDAFFITLSVTDEVINMMTPEEQADVNLAARIMIRKWLERVRKHTKKSVKHWLIAEIGQQATERIHLHGVVWTDDILLLMRCWGLGNTWWDWARGEITANYVSKYITKPDEKNTHFKPRVFASAGIGMKYVDKVRRVCRFNGKDTIRYRRNSSGLRESLPTYVKRKIWTDEEREELRLITIEVGEIRVDGWVIKVCPNGGHIEILKARRRAHRIRLEKEFGHPRNWIVRKTGVRKDIRENYEKVGKDNIYRREYQTGLD